MSLDIGPIEHPASLKSRAYTALKDAILRTNIYDPDAQLRLDERALSAVRADLAAAAVPAVLLSPAVRAYLAAATGPAVLGAPSVCAGCSAAGRGGVGRYSRGFGRLLGGVQRAGPAVASLGACREATLWYRQVFAGRFAPPQPGEPRRHWPAEDRCVVAAGGADRGQRRRCAPCLCSVSAAAAGHGPRMRRFDENCR